MTGGFPGGEESSVSLRERTPQGCDRWLTPRLVRACKRWASSNVEGVKSAAVVLSGSARRRAPKVTDLIRRE